MTHQFNLILLGSLIFIRFLSLTLEGLCRELGISVNLACRHLEANTLEERLTLSWNNDSILSAVSLSIEESLTL
jgi:hypothetical protein